MKKAVILLSALAILAHAPRAAAQDEFISYKLDGKEVRLTDVRLLWHADNYLTIEGVAKEKVDFGENAYPRFRESEAGVTFQISPEGDSFVGTYKASSSDTLPVYVSSYEVVKKDGLVEVLAHTADMDSSFEGQMFTVTIENFGGEGALVKGTFSGKLKGDDDKLHAVEAGVFALRRKNIKD
jgi:hypothetical protein